MDTQELERATRLVGKHEIINDLKKCDRIYFCLGTGLDGNYISVSNAGGDNIQYIWDQGAIDLFRKFLDDLIDPKLREIENQLNQLGVFLSSEEVTK